VKLSIVQRTYAGVQYTPSLCYICFRHAHLQQIFVVLDDIGF